MARRRGDKLPLRQQPISGNRNSYVKVSIMTSCLIAAVCIGFKGYLETRVNTRFDSLRMVEKTGLDVPERYWGTYRPGLYFGMKTREPHSLAFGLMWYFPRLLKSNGDGIRHWCEQTDNLEHYSWTEHDGKNFGIQHIQDGPFQIRTDFVKRLGGNHGGDWTAHVSVTSQDEKRDKELVSLVIYVALEEKAEGWIRRRDDFEIQGETNMLGGFKLTLKNVTGSIVSNSYLSTVAPGLDLLKETFISNLKVVSHHNQQRLVLPGDVLRASDGTLASANFIALQVTAHLPFELAVAYESYSFSSRPNSLIGSVYDQELKKHQTQFHEKFEKIFRLQEKGFKDKEIKFAKAALSNMVGGIGYFYGASRVSSSHTKGTVPYWKAPLYTAVPSRSFFPRGFLWDEAFHGLLISNWDLEIELDIMHHWFDLMNIEGWIPREQILGVEAISKVPEEFVTQVNTNANPPVFFLTLQHIIHRHGNELRDKGQLNKLERMYDRFEAWYDWFNTTQKGKLATSYRWQGRDPTTNRELNPRTLTSGLDDYPRASHPSEDERHVDLRCWLAMASSTLAELASLLGKDPSRYAQAYRALADTPHLNLLHWSEHTKSYADFGLHTDSVVMKKKYPSQRQSDSKPQPPSLVRVSLQDPTQQFVDSHFGYVSLFPFLLKILPADSAELEITLRKLQDETLLWTRFGLRSLATTSSLYGKYNTEHDPPYWRGAIWININYLAVRALYHYSQTGPYQQTAQKLYIDLRQNLIDNVVREYYRTGYVWEQYSDITGEGKGCRPFTGWSALTVLMMAEIY